MSSLNASPCSENPDSSEIHDIPIVPPQPIARKDYKEIVPDISVTSDIADNESKLQNFQKDYFRSQIGSKYFQNQLEFKTDMLSKSNFLPVTPDNLFHRNMTHKSNQQQLEIGSHISKTVKLTEGTDPIMDHNTILPVQIYFDSACPSCVTNQAVITNKASNGIQSVLPINSSSSLLAVNNEQSNKEIRYKSDEREFISNKTCCKHIESNTNFSHESVTCNHAQLSCPSSSKEPKISRVLDCCCSQDQLTKLRKNFSKYEKHTSSDSGLGESRKSEEVSKKETLERNVIKNRNILCPTCWKKTTCACNFSSKKLVANSSQKSNNSEQITEENIFVNSNQVSSSDLSSIREYLRRQDEKIDTIHKKVLSFLSQHESCYVDHPTQGDKLSNATESDIPYILNILEVHSEKIRELQDEITLLKSCKSSSPANNKIDESVLNEAPTTNCAKTDTCDEVICSPCSCNVSCPEQGHKVTKTSTSTMTSFALENNDKFVYHKQLTVVTDVTKEKKGSSSSSPKEHDFPTTNNHLDVKNVNSNSQKRKSHKLNKCSPKLKCKTNVSSGSSDVPENNDNQVLKTSHKSERRSKRASAGNKVTDEAFDPEEEFFSAEIKNALRNVNDLAMKENNVKERKNSPTHKIAALKSHSRSSKKSASPKVVDIGIIRGLESKKITRKISTSSSSTDSESQSPTPMKKVFDSIELDSEKESTTKSKYGLSSKYLSIATKTYLDKFHLYRDKNNRTDSS